MERRGFSRIIGGSARGFLPVWVPLLLVALSFVSASYRIQNPDVFWHLSAARYIVVRGEIPTHEFSSFTAGGRPWTDYEWGFQLFAYGLWSVGGFALLVAAKALLVAVIVYVLYRACCEAGGDDLLAALLAIVAVVQGRGRFDVRPELFTFLFLAITVLLVGRFREGRARALWFVPPLFVLWANLHPGFVFGLGYLGLVAAGEAANALVQGREALRRAAALGIATGASAVLALAGPNLGRPYLLILESVRLYKSVGLRNLEWEPTFTAGLQAAPFWILAAGVLAVLLLDRRRGDFADVLAAGAFAFLGAHAVRNAALFPFIAAPVFARSIANLRPGSAGDATGRGRRRLAWTVVGVEVLLLAASLGRGGWDARLRPYGFVTGYGFDHRFFPAGAAAWAEESGLRGNLFNDFPFGGYLGWRLPDRKVFIDGKHIPYIPLLRELETALRGGYGTFRQLLQKYGVEWAVVRYPPGLQKVLYPSPGGGVQAGLRAWSAVYFHRKDWALVYWDDVAMVFVRRYGPNAPAVTGKEYLALNPDDWAWTLEEVRSGRRAPGPILEELDRKLAGEPGCHRARVLREWFGKVGAGPAPASGPDEAGDEAVPIRGR